MNHTNEIKMRVIDDLKLIIFEYLTAFTIFSHEIEHMGSSTTALKGRLNPEIQNFDRK